MKKIRLLVCMAIMFITTILITNSTYAVEQTKFKININKVDENGEQLDGAAFSVMNDTTNVSVTDNGNRNICNRGHNN